MNNLSYSVGKPILYMKGDANGWNGYDYLAGDDGVHFTGFMYLNQNGFKFTTAQTGVVLAMAQTLVLLLMLITS